jgi:hypothetical protein
VAKGEMTEKGVKLDRLVRHSDVWEWRRRGDGG